MYYRLYFTNSADHITNVLPFDCTDDIQAQSVAALRAQGATYELWNRERLVTRKQKARDNVDCPMGLQPCGFNI